MSHVKDIDETLLEQMRVLKSRGVILIMDANPLNPHTFFSCFIANYLTSRNSEIKRGWKWIFHRDEPFYELAQIKEGIRIVCWKDENIHTKYWWKNKLEPYSDEIGFEISNFWSYLPTSLFKLVANKILVVGGKI